MRVALIFYRTLSSQSSASLTMGYLAAHLRHAGHEVTLWQLEATDEPNDVAGGPSALDVVFYKPNFKDLHHLDANLAALRHRYPTCTFCLLGPFAVLNAARILADLPFVRGVLLPNHEALAAQWLPWLLDPAAPRPDAGLLWTQDGEVRFALADEAALGASIRELRPARDVELREPLHIVNMEASRGCPRACTFCHEPAVMALGGRRVVRREPEDVVDEMADLVKQGKRYFIFNDPIFGGGGPDGADWIHAFCEALGERRLGIQFMVYLTLQDLARRPALIDRMAEAGLIRVFVGIESGCDEGVKRFRKGIRVSAYRAVKEALLARQVVPHIGFMLFHPFASVTEVREGLAFLAKTGEIHRFGVINERTRLVPGTPLLAQSLAADLVRSPDYRAIAHGYTFADPATAAIFERFQTAFARVGVPLLERIEHLLVTGEFIENLARRFGTWDSEVASAVAAFRTLRQAYEREIAGWCGRLLEQEDEGGGGDPFPMLWTALEASWDGLLAATEAAGLPHPLKWIPSGDLRSEVGRDHADGGHRLTTRSGRITVDALESCR